MSLPEPGILAAIGAACVWAMSSTLMASQLSRTDAGTVSALRLMWASLFFVTALFALGAADELGEMSLSHAMQIIAGAVLGLALGDTIYVMSMTRLGVGRAFTISLGLFTVLTYILAIIFLDEPMTVPIAIGSALVIVAVVIVSRYGKPPEVRAAGEVPLPGSRRVLLVGLAMLVATGICWAVASVWLRYIAVDYNAVAIGATRIPAAAAVMLGVAAVRPTSFVRRRSVTRRTVLLLGVAGIFGTGMGSLLYIYALQEAGAGRTVVLTALSPLFALPMGAIFLGEAITRWVAFGTVLAVAGIVLLSV